MATVIGLRSGKEFVIEEEYYPFTHQKTGSVTTIFVSADRKRMITVPPPESPIEFFDEPADDKLLKNLETSVIVGDETEEGVFNDPNVR